MADAINSQLILELEALDNNWDSYGGLAPTEDALSTLAQLHVVPLATGGIQVELRDPNDRLVEVEIDDDGIIGTVAVG